MSETEKQLAKKVDKIFVEPEDYELERAIEMFNGSKYPKKLEKENMASAWNDFVREIRARQKTVYETGVLSKGPRNKLVGILENASYDWLDEESGFLVPVVDIYIIGYQAFRLNSLDLPYSKNEPISGVAEIKGVECEFVALPEHADTRKVKDIGLGIVSPRVEMPDVFAGDERYIFVSADRLVSSPAGLRSTSTR